MQIIKRGAEAVLYIDSLNDEKVLVKERIKKGYRIPVLDEKIRLGRTKSEEKLIRTASRVGVSAPRIFNVSDFKIIMQWLDGKTLKDCLNEKTDEERIKICSLVGENIGKLHEAGIIHGDLTTSNMIAQGASDATASHAPYRTIPKKKNTNHYAANLFFIDFGLGKFSKKIEDQAVDLFLLYEALKAAHYNYLNESWQNILKTYKQTYSNADKVLRRLKEIEKRRRYKGG